MSDKQPALRKKPKEEFKVSSITDWKKNIAKTTKMTLPSGTNVEVKRLDIMELVLSGHIPLDMLSKSMKVGKSFDTGIFDGISKEEIKEMLDMMKKAVVLAVVEPKVSFEPDKNSMDVNKLHSNDILFIFNAAVDTTSMSGGVSTYL
jgi:hypothetical protein